MTGLSRRRLLIETGRLSLGVGAAGALGACAGAVASPSPRPTGASASGLASSAPPSGRVTYWWGGSADLQQYFIDDWVPSFHQAFPEVELNISWKSRELNPQIQTALQAGQGPDLVHTPGPSYATDFVKAGFLLPLDKYAEANGWADKIVPWALDAGRIDGTLFSLPENQETLIIYTNATLFDQMGWKAPSNRQELESICDEAMGNGIVPFATGIGDAPSVTGWYLSAFFNHYAGPQAMHDVLTGAVPWTDPVFVEAAALFNDYVQKGWFGGSVELYFTNTLGNLYAQHGEGKAAMDVEGSWHLADIADYFGAEANNANEWDWAPVPPLNDGVPAEMYALAVGGTIGINSSSEVADAAASYLDWTYSDPKRLASAFSRGLFEFLLPVVFEESDLPDGLDPRLARFLASYSQSTGEGRIGYTSWTFMPAKANSFLYEGMNRVIVGDLTPAEYTAQLDAAFKEGMAEGLLPPVPPPG